LLDFHANAFLPMTRSKTLSACLLVSLSAACVRSPETRAKGFLESGDRYVAQQQFKEAAIQYRNASQATPRSAAAHTKLAETYARLGQGADALSEYVRAADLDPANVDLQLAAARYLVAGRRFDEALKKVDAVIASAPTTAEAYMLRGTVLAGLNDFERAVGDIEEAIRLDPNEGKSYANLGVMQLALGQSAQAQASFKKAIALAPDWVYGYLAFANYHWSAGRVADAEQALRDALRVKPDEPLANRAMAALLMSSGRRNEAEPYVKRVAELVPSVQTTLLLADYYVACGRTDDAVRVLESLAASHKGDAAIGTRLALAHARAGDRKKAYDVLEPLLAKDPRDANALLVRAKLLLADGRTTDAFQALQAAIDCDSSLVEAHFLLGKLYAARGDAGGATKSFTQVLTLNPRAAAAQVELAKLRVASGSPDQALRLARDAARSAGNQLEVRLTLIRTLIATKQFADADREIRRLLDENPSNADAQVQRGFMAMAMKNPPAARAAFTKALELTPQSIEALNGLVALDIDARDFAAAKERLDKRLAGATPTPGLLLLAARMHAGMNDMAAAERYLRQALERDGSFLPAYGMLAQIYIKQNWLDAARREFDSLAERQTNPVAALTLAGMLLERQGDTEGARDRFQRAVAADSRAAVAANNLAWLIAEHGGDMNRALELAQSATTAQPDEPAMMDTLGWVYYKKDLALLAIPLFSRASEKQPSSGMFLYHLGLAYARTGDGSKARAALTRALATNPDPALRRDLEKTLAATPAAGAF
jgi:tetratricopeptide (TPR) repeat protein